MMLNNPALTPGLRSRSSNAAFTPMDENSLSIRRPKSTGKGLSQSSFSSARKKNSMKNSSSTSVRTRRAFGDISNQDNNARSNQHHNITVPIKPNLTTSKHKSSKSVSFQPSGTQSSTQKRSQKIKSKKSSSSNSTSKTRLKATQQQSSKPITPRNINYTAHREFSSIKRNSSKKLFEIHTDESSRAKSTSKQVPARSKEQKKTAPVVPYEDIELSAGRMW